MDTTSLLNALLEKKDLTKEGTQTFLDNVVAGTMTPAQIAAVIVALRMKGETAREIA